VQGDNAEGKTSLLESIYLLAIGKSFRAENEGEVVNWHSAATGEIAVVDGAFERADGRLRVIVGYQPVQTARDITYGQPEGGSVPIRKEVTLNGVRKTLSELVGKVNAVLFTAQDLDIVFGSPSVRRRFLDILISQTDRAYLRALQRYQQVLQHRNGLLKLLREGRAKESELSFWDEELVKTGTLILLKRVQTLQVLCPLVERSHKSLTNEGEKVDMRYVSTVPLSSDLGELDQSYAETLAATRKQEVALGATLAGPHRDDIKLLLNSADMTSYGSRGQARTFAVALRFAEASFFARVRREEPIVLLDDVLSELDPRRRRLVVESVARRGQVFITCTDMASIDIGLLPLASVFRLRGGAISLM
jgi:DNA replication and repair protein RecF